MALSIGASRSDSTNPMDIADDILVEMNILRSGSTGRACIQHIRNILAVADRKKKKVHEAALSYASENIHISDDEKLFLESFRDKLRNL